MHGAVSCFKKYSAIIDICVAEIRGECRHFDKQIVLGNRIFFKYLGTQSIITLTVCFAITYFKKMKDQAT